MPPIFGQWGW